jgi:RimJ/RimL family protein N-acetyltransferase
MYDTALQIVTPRLILRQPRLCDLDAWAGFMADPEATRHIGGVQSRPVVWRALATITGAWVLTGCSMFSVLERSSGEWIGRIGPWRPEGWPGTEVGWGIRREYWGRGYATEGAIAAIDWAFAELGWTEVIHTIPPDNQGSQSVARRLGSARLRPGRLPPPYEQVEVDVWGQTRAQWQAQRARLPLRAG